MFIIPVDLAAVKDWTAVGAVDVSAEYPRTYKVPHLDRWRAAYPETVERVAALANTPPLTDAVLVVDGTGVGKPVVDMLRAALPGRVVYSIVITGGSRVTRGDGPTDIRVPKRDLVGAAQVLLGSGRLAVARELPLADVLVTELTTFQIKITPALNEQFESGREGVNDDLVLALSMAAWLGENLPGPLTDAAVDGLVLNARPGDDTDDDQRPRTRMETIAGDHPHLFDTD